MYVNQFFDLLSASIHKTYGFGYNQYKPSAILVHNFRKGQNGIVKATSKATFN